MARLHAHPLISPLLQDGADSGGLGRRAMEALVDDGLARSIGVSNFSEAQIEELLGFARISPVANQVELHPRLAQRRLVGFCTRKVAAVAHVHTIPVTR